MGSGQDNDCHNIDECKLKIDNCGEKGDKGTYCQDNDGSFDCFCLPGFHMAESGRCENTNECLEGLVYRLISYSSKFLLICREFQYFHEKIYHRRVVF